MKILAGLSGGVDSAVAAYLLKEQGHEVTGAIMSIWDDTLPAPAPGINNYACLGPEEKDIEAAAKIAELLKIPFKVIDCREEYKRIVIENFKEEYKKGRTPNPCIICNSRVKFGVLPRGARRAGVEFDKFATGHYAKTALNENGFYELKRPLDEKRDQTYFLYRLTQKQLSETLFPLADYTKDKVREIARAAGLPAADKPDSQDFYCGDYNDILKFSAKPGEIIDKTGKVVGKHDGIWNFTIGKRKGLGISGSKEPVYVTGIYAKENVVVVGTKEDLYSESLTAEEISWTLPSAPAMPLKVLAKIRQQHPPAPAEIRADGKNLKVFFDSPQMSVTSGQSVVFYDARTGQSVLGGGIIR